LAGDIADLRVYIVDAGDEISGGGHYTLVQDFYFEADISKIHFFFFRNIIFREQEPTAGRYMGMIAPVFNLHETDTSIVKSGLEPVRLIILYSELGV